MCVVALTFQLIGMVVSAEAGAAENAAAAINRALIVVRSGSEPRRSNRVMQVHLLCPPPVPVHPASEQSRTRCDRCRPDSARTGFSFAQTVEWFHVVTSSLVRPDFRPRPSSSRLPLNAGKESSWLSRNRIPSRLIVARREDDRW